MGRFAEDATLLRPLLPIRFPNNTGNVQAAGLVDSGADVNILPYSLGLAIGLQFDEHLPIEPPSGNLRRYEARRAEILCTVGMFDPVQLLFVWTTSPEAPLILGQLNFFLEFNVCLFRSKGMFEIQPK